jgi:hypothetical protein
MNGIGLLIGMKKAKTVHLKHYIIQKGDLGSKITETVAGIVLGK